MRERDFLRRGDKARVLPLPLKRNTSGFSFLRRFRLARTVEGDGLANERLEGGLVNFFTFVDANRATNVAVETRVEEKRGMLQRRAHREGRNPPNPEWEFKQAR